MKYLIILSLILIGCTETTVNYNQETHLQWCDYNNNMYIIGNDPVEVSVTKDIIFLEIESKTTDSRGKVYIVKSDIVYSDTLIINGNTGIYKEGMWPGEIELYSCYY